LLLWYPHMTSTPFSAKSLPPRYEKFHLRDEIVQTSREKYGVPRAEIEDKIDKWSRQTYSEKGNRSVNKERVESDVAPVADRRYEKKEEAVEEKIYKVKI